jgi:hypothetical protein
MRAAYYEANGPARDVLKVGDQIAQAHEAVESGHAIGNVVLQIPG